MMSGLSLKFLCILIIVYINLITAKQHEHIDLGFLLENETLLGKFVDCILGEGPCKGEIDKLKSLIPELIETKCDVCQKEMGKLSMKMMLYIRNEKPESWKKIQDKFDPNGKHHGNIEQMLEAHQ